jgi:hypothetical protein
MSTLERVFSDGYLFEVETLSDADYGMPWKESDGHGVVLDAYKDAIPATAKRLDFDGRYHYDVDASLVKATSERWGISQDDLIAFNTTRGRLPNDEEITKLAVTRDYEYLRDYCTGVWEYVTVRVTLCKVDEDAEGFYYRTQYSASLGGVESNDLSARSETRAELIKECVSNYRAACLKRVQQIALHRFTFSHSS